MSPSVYILPHVSTFSQRPGCSSLKRPHLPPKSTYCAQQGVRGHPSAVLGSGARSSGRIRAAAPHSHHVHMETAVPAPRTVRPYPHQAGCKDKKGSDHQGGRKSFYWGGERAEGNGFREDGVFGLDLEGGRTVSTGTAAGAGARRLETPDGQGVPSPMRNN